MNIKKEQRPKRLKKIISKVVPILIFIVSICIGIEIFSMQSSLDDKYNTKVVNVISVGDSAIDVVHRFTDIDIVDTIRYTTIKDFNIYKVGTSHSINYYVPYKNGYYFFTMAILGILLIGIYEYNRKEN